MPRLDKRKKSKHFGKTSNTRRKGKRRNTTNNSQLTEGTIRDKRFSKVFNDPKFSEFENTDNVQTGNKIKLDSRFSEMLTNPAFQDNCYVFEVLFILAQNNPCT